MAHQIDVAHVLGQVVKWIVIFAVFGVSITMSYMFFMAIAPPDKPWFAIAGLSLTEGGFLAWMFVYRMIKYHPVHKSIALIMTLACALCSLSVAGFELYSLLASHFDLLTNPLVAQYVAYLLEAIFMAHFISLIAELLVGENEKNPFVQRGGAQPVYQIEEQRGEPARPLASRRRQSQTQPKAEPATFDQEAEVEIPEEIEEPKPRELKPLPKPRRNSEPVQSPIKRPPPLQTHQGDTLGDMLKEGASSLTQKLRGSIGSTRRAVPVRGKTSQTIEENM